MARPARTSSTGEPTGRELRSSARSESRIHILDSVTTPLGFFVLTVLVVEAGLGVLSTTLPQSERSQIVFYMILVLVLLILVVASLAYFSPDALTGRRPDPYTVVIAASGNLAEIDMALISWDPDKCFLNYSGQTWPVIPALGEKSTNLEIKLDSEILKKVSGARPLYVELVDSRGFRWGVRPFFLYQKSVDIFSHAKHADIVDAYGDQQ
jgi:hypothetical protein